MVVINFLKNSLLFGMCIGIGLIALLYGSQQKLLYIPIPGVGIPRRTSENTHSMNNPSYHGIKHKNIFIKTVDGAVIHAWLLLHNTKPENVPTIIYFHGNAGNIGHRMPNLVEMMQYLDTNILMVEYRGYGDSNCPEALALIDELSSCSEQAMRRAELISPKSHWKSVQKDEPSEIGLKLDAISAFDYLVHFNDGRDSDENTKIDPSRIFLFGRSLGGAVCMSLLNTASILSLPHERHHINGVILENTFLSIPKMASEILPTMLGFKRKQPENPNKFNLVSWLLKFVCKYLVRMKWDSESVMSSGLPLSTNILFISGRRDEIVPVAQMDSLFGLATDNKDKLDLKLVEKLEVKDGTHNDTWLKGSVSYYMRMKKFMTDAMDSYNSVN